MMDSLFKIQIAQEWLKVFIDDLLIANEGDMLNIIEKALIVLKILAENDLFVKPEKCSFFVARVEFLRFIIKNGTIRMDPVKLEGIIG